MTSGEVEVKGCVDVGGVGWCAVLGCGGVVLSFGEFAAVVVRVTASGGVWWPDAVRRCAGGASADRVADVVDADEVGGSGDAGG